MPIKVALERFIEVFNGERAGLMENAAHFGAWVDKRVAAVLAGTGGHWESGALSAHGLQWGVAVVLIAQQKTQFRRPFPDEGGARSLSGAVAVVRSAASAIHIAAPSTGSILCPSLTRSARATGHPGWVRTGLGQPAHAGPARVTIRASPTVRSKSM